MKRSWPGLSANKWPSQNQKPGPAELGATSKLGHCWAYEDLLLNSLSVVFHSSSSAEASSTGCP